MERKVVYSDAGHLKERVLMSQSPSPPLSGGRDFYKEGEGNRTEIKGGGCKVLYVQMSTVHSGQPSDGPVCVILD